MRLTPFGHRVLVREYKKEEVTSAGIVLPGGEGLVQYEVLEVGLGAWSAGKLCPPQCKKGDIVLMDVQELDRNGSCRVNNERCWLVEAPQIVAKVEEDEPEKVVN